MIYIYIHDSLFSWLGTDTSIEYVQGSKGGRKPKGQSSMDNSDTGNNGYMTQNEKKNATNVSQKTGL